MLDEVEERRRRPVQVLQHEDDGARLARASRAGGGSAQAVSSTGPRSPGLARGRRDRRPRPARRRARRRARPRPSRRRSTAGEPGERVAERGVRRRHRRGRRPADEARRASDAGDRPPRGRAASCRRPASRRPSRAARGPRGSRAGRPRRSPRARRSRPTSGVSRRRTTGSASSATRSDGVAAVSPLARSTACRTSRQAAVADEHLGLAGGGRAAGRPPRAAGPRRSGRPCGGVAGDDVAGRDAGADDEPARRSSHAARTARSASSSRAAGTPKIPSTRVVGGATGLAAVGLEGRRPPRRGGAELARGAPRDRLGTTHEVGEQDRHRLARLLDAARRRAAARRRRARRAPRPGAGSPAGAPAAPRPARCRAPRRASRARRAYASSASAWRPER